MGQGSQLELKLRQFAIKNKPKDIFSKKPSHFKRHSAGYFNMADGFGRNFLLLQDPHGPFFSQLGTLVEQTGATAWRVGFNGGDAFFWRNKARFIAHA